MVIYWTADCAPAEYARAGAGVHDQRGDGLLSSEHDEQREEQLRRHLILRDELRAICSRACNPFSDSFDYPGYEDN